MQRTLSAGTRWWIRMWRDGCHRQVVTLRMHVQVVRHSRRHQVRGRGAIYRPRRNVRTTAHVWEYVEGAAWLTHGRCAKTQWKLTTGEAADSRHVELGEVDFLFIDSLHTYWMLKERSLPFLLFISSRTKRSWVMLQLAAVAGPLSADRTRSARAGDDEVHCHARHCVSRRGLLFCDCQMTWAIFQ